MLSEEKVREYQPYAFICDDASIETSIETIDPAAGDDAAAETEREPRFWRRQFGRTATKKQRFYDWAFGVVMPVICFAFDPIVFKNDHDPILGRYVIFGYMLSFASIMTTMAWLIWGDRLKGSAVVASGIMAGGALAALVIAVILFPFSLLGLALMIGALGFTPFFTSVIWARNAVRAYRSAQGYIEEPVLCHAVGLTALLSLVIPIVANSEIGRETLSELARLVR
jgi:hypothetical protein